MSGSSFDSLSLAQDARERARERAIADRNAILDGRVESDARSVLWRWDDHHLVHLRWLIPQIVDAMLRAIRPSSAVGRPCEEEPRSD